MPMTTKELAAEAAADKINNEPKNIRVFTATRMNSIASKKYGLEKLYMLICDNIERIAEAGVYKTRLPYDLVGPSAG